MKPLRRGISLVYVALACALVALLVGGCATTATPTATSAPSKATAATASTAPAGAKSTVTPIKLKFSDPSGTGTARTDAEVWWGEELKKRTEGRLEVEFYWSESLAKAQDMVKAAQGGIADISMNASLSYGPTVWPLWQSVDLVFLSGDYQVHSKVVNELYNTVPELKAEMDMQGLKTIYIGTVPTSYFVTKQPLKKLEDFKGLKMGAGGIIAEWVKAVGGTTQSIPIYERYEALQKGTIDGSPNYIYLIPSMKLQEVAKYINMTPLQAPTYQIYMSEASWNKITPADQKIIMDLWPDLQAKTNQLNEEYYQKDLKTLKDAGVQFYDPPADEIARWKAAAKPIWDKWVETAKAKNFDGNALITKIQDLTAKYEKK